MTPEQTASTYNQIAQHWDCPEFDSSNGINQHERALSFVSNFVRALDICGGLAQDGVLIFTTGGVNKPDEVTNPCFGQPLYHAAPGIPAILQALGESDCSCRHLEYDHYPEKHVYVIALRA